MRVCRALAAVVVVALCLAATPARAFTVGSAFTDGCHEQITEAALRNVRATLPTAKPIEPNGDESALIEDLPFSLPDDMRDLASASLLIGVRDNDLKGRAVNEVDELAIVVANPTTQQEHCLRGPGDDEPNGSIIALGHCGTFMHDRALSAIDALDGSGVPDPNVRQDLDVWLSLRQRVTASLPAFWIRIGQALHALQDSFSHTYRTPDGMKVTTVLNWVDWVNDVLVETRDGPPHKMVMDRCDDADAIRKRNRQLATQASTEFLTAALDPSLTPAQKSSALDEIIAKYTSFEPGCTAENGWCNAPEDAYPASCACTTAGGGRAGILGIVAFAGVALLARKRRRARIAAAASTALLALVLPTTAHAQTVPPPAEEPWFAIAANLGGSVADPALAQSVGIRVRIGSRFMLGADAELNEWFDINGGRVEVGSANFYATGILRYPMSSPALELRTTLQFGAAYQIVNLFGVPTGSVGIFGGVYPLGLAFHMAHRISLTLDPLGVAVPVPQLTGAPFAFPQFRSQLGVEIGL